MMKKLMFAALVLSAGLFSCSNKEDVVDGGGNDKEYVQVTIGGASVPGLRSSVSASGVTNWSVGDKVIIIDADGDKTLQPFTYNGTVSQSSGKFTGLLKAGLGAQLYRTYHIPSNSTATLLNKQYIVLDGVQNNVLTEEAGKLLSDKIGSFCPMVAFPQSFDAEGTPPSALQFHHITSLIEARIALATPDYLGRPITKVVFEVIANSAVPFNSKVKYDLFALTTTSDITNMKSGVIETADPRTASLSTTVELLNPTTIGDLIDDLGFYSVPIVALPTLTPFAYTAKVTFYNGATAALELSGTGNATGLFPAGLNTLNFDDSKVIP